MTDLDTLKDMYDRAKVIYEVYDKPRVMSEEGMNFIIVVEGDNGPHNRGYYGMCCKHYFDEDGQLINVGCWE